MYAFTFCIKALTEYLPKKILPWISPMLSHDTKNQSINQSLSLADPWNFSFFSPASPEELVVVVNLPQLIQKNESWSSSSWFYYYMHTNVSGENRRTEKCEHAHCPIAKQWKMYSTIWRPATRANHVKVSSVKYYLLLIALWYFEAKCNICTFHGLNYTSAIMECFRPEMVLGWCGRTNILLNGFINAKRKGNGFININN